MKLGLPQYAMGASLLVIGYLGLGSGGSQLLSGVAAASSPARLSGAVLQPDLPVVKAGDPFRLAGRHTRFKDAAKSTRPDPTATPESLDAVLISGDQRRAVIDGMVRTEGQSWRTQSGTAKLVRVEMNRVIVELAGRTLELRLNANPTSGTKSSRRAQK